MNKLNRIKQYNANNLHFNITNIKKMTQAMLNSYKSYNHHDDIYSLYKKPSQYKINSWRDILDTYKPHEVISIQGNSQTYSVILQASNGDILHITRCNNYLIDIV